MENEKVYSAPIPTAAQIEKTLPQNASSPMEFLKEIMDRPSPGQTPREAAPTTNTPEPLRVPTTPDKPEIEKSVETKNLDGLESLELGEEVVLATKETTPEIEDTSVPLSENYKTLKTTYKETKQKLQTIQEEKQALEDKVKLYDSGEALPERIQEYEDELSRAEKFVKLYDLQSSRQYKEKFIKPVEEIKSTIFAKAEEYGVPQDVMEEALSLDKRGLAQFIDENFSNVDEDDAYEIKQSIKKMNGIYKEQLAANTEPQKIREQLEEEFAASEVQRKRNIANELSSVSQRGWITALTNIRSEGKAIELIPKAHDDKFNETIVRPIVNAASKEFGKLIRALSDNGLEKLPEELARGLGEMVLRAHATAISFDTRDLAMREAADIRESSIRTAKYDRPNLGRRSASGGSGSTETPVRGGTPESIRAAADATLAAGRAAAANQRR